MSFCCPECTKSDSLNINLLIELLPNNDSSEIDLQIVECFCCGFQGVAVYEESKRGSLESESWRHQGYKVNKEKLNVLIEEIRRCPDPCDRHCQCASHQSLSRVTQDGQLIEVMNHEGSFPMRFGLNKKRFWERWRWKF